MSAADGKIGSDSSYVSNLLISCVVATAVHLLLGVFLKWLLKNKPDLKGWELYTYIHSMVHTGIFMPACLLYVAFHVKFWTEYLTGSAWHAHPFLEWSGLGVEHWVQTANIGFQVAITILSLGKILKTPSLVFHHIVTILGCVALLHPLHCVGYGFMFTAFTEFGSTMHNIMSLWNNTNTRWARVVTDVITRGGGLALILCEAPVARSLELPLYLQVWSYVGGFAWFALNGMWTKHILTGLLKGRKKEEKAK